MKPQSKGKGGDGHMVVICQSPTVSEDVLNITIEAFGHDNILCFNSSVEFIRWLFGQCADEPGRKATLVTGWREAKPCVSAFQATRSGCTEHLRPDAKRPEIRMQEGAPAEGGGGVDFEQLIVVPSIEQSNSVQKRQQAKAMKWKWAQSEEVSSESLNINVATTVNELASFLVQKTLEPEKAGGEGRGALALPINASELRQPPAGCRLRTPSPEYIYKWLPLPRPQLPLSLPPPNLGWGPAARRSIPGPR